MEETFERQESWDQWLPSDAFLRVVAAADALVPTLPTRADQRFYWMKLSKPSSTVRTTDPSAFEDRCRELNDDAITDLTYASDVSMRTDHPCVKLFESRAEWNPGRVFLTVAGDDRTAVEGIFAQLVQAIEDEVASTRTALAAQEEASAGRDGAAGREDAETPWHSNPWVVGIGSGVVLLIVTYLIGR